uniref:Uncharacterized protein n=1 Tax=Phlebotomus papatasi TaxID=29031 RepID=A0A1B0DQY0_PHLPP
MKKVIQFCVVLPLFCAIGGVKNNGVEEMYYWREVMYENLPLNDNAMIGKYPYHIPTNNDVYGAGYHAKSGLMLTTVGRIRPGVPSSLNGFCVSDYEKGSSPHFWGFPNYEMNTLKASFYEGTTDYSRSRSFRRKAQKYSAGYYNHFYGNYNPLEDFSIVSVYRPNIDDVCNRLYVMDTGLLHYSATEVYNVQNPALIVFDLPSNGCQTRKFPVIRRVEIPNHLWNDPTGFCYITHDHQPKGSCDDVILYIANSFGDNSLTVYDYKKGSFWTFNDPSFNPIAAESKIVFNYHNYELPVAIVNVALGWPDKNGNRNAYYFPAASTGEYIVSTEVLKDRKRAPSNYSPGDFSLIAYRG